MLNIGGKKNIIITVIILGALGFGFLLYKISPQDGGANPFNDLKLNPQANLSEPRQAGADDYILGNAQAKNVMVIYEDFQCPACANYAPIVKRFPSELADVKVVFRHYPLPQHKNGIIASLAAEAAGAQGKFWEFYEKLYVSQDEWSSLKNPLDKFAQLAGQVGVGNLEQFKNDVLGKKFKSKLEKDMSEAAGLKVSGTPSLYFNGKSLQLGSLEQVKQQAEKLYRK